MNLPNLGGTGLVGLIFIILLFGLMIVFRARNRSRSKILLREIPAFSRLKRGVGLAVEAGQGVHISLGHGGIYDIQGASALIGLSILHRIARAASISDKPPMATSGEAELAILSQDTLRSAFQASGAASQYQPDLGQLSGLTPLSYASGTLSVVNNQGISVNILAGHFGSEVALITDAAERSGSLSLGGSNNLTAQAVLYSTAQEPLIGEELYACGAYIQAGPMHTASLQSQDILRWVIVTIIIVGSFLKLIGIV